MADTGFPAQGPTGTRPASGSAVGPHRSTQDAGSPPSMRMISPLRASFKALKRSGTNGSKSASRFDLARRIRMAMFLPARFCSYASPLSMVTKISQPALSARSSRAPFFLLARPASGTVRHSRSGRLYFQLPWDALVEENLHPSWPARTELASSNAEMAASRVTVGKSSVNSARVWPPSK